MAVYVAPGYGSPAHILHISLVPAQIAPVLGTSITHNSSGSWPEHKEHA